MSIIFITIVISNYKHLYFCFLHKKITEQDTGIFVFQNILVF